MSSLEDFHTFLKKKGFIYPSSELYGGLAGFYDYGHLGTLLKHNFENQWRNFFLNLSDNFFEIETANIMHQNVFKASGHLDNFIDPIIKCTQCQFNDRADHFLESQLKARFEGLSPTELDTLIQKNKLQCPQCKHKLKPVEVLNMMFPINLGTTTTNQAYLRPETAQSPYVNFRLQYEIQRKKMPLGLALVGRAYRNEISPRNLTLRQREFTQAELQIFFNPANIKEHPDFKSIENKKLLVVLTKDRKKTTTPEIPAKDLIKTLPQFYVYHLAKIQEFYLTVLKIPKTHFRLYQLNDKEKAFYNKYHFDLEINLNHLGFTEMGGLHYRTDHDLQGHQRVSQQNLEVLDEQTNKKYLPHVLELSFGVDRNVYALLALNYLEDTKRGNIVLKLPSSFTPFQVAVFPLVKNKSPITKLAQKIYQQLKPCYSCFYDESSSVGKRYARADEIGVSYIITVDFDSLKDQAVTVRDRNTTKQQRIKISELNNYLYKLYQK